jgi:hypothetical protein
MRAVPDGEWDGHDINDFTLNLFTEAIDEIGFPGITGDWILESMGLGE